MGGIISAIVNNPFSLLKQEEKDDPAAPAAVAAPEPADEPGPANVAPPTGAEAGSAEDQTGVGRKRRAKAAASPLSTLSSNVNRPTILGG